MIPCQPFLRLLKITKKFFLPSLMGRQRFFAISLGFYEFSEKLILMIYRADINHYSDSVNLKMHFSLTKGLKMAKKGFK